MISNVFSVIAIINIKIILLSAQFMNYPINYPFGPFYYPPAEPTFEDIIKRRQNFDIESVMDFPTEPPSEPPEEVNDNQLHDDRLYNENQQNENHKNDHQLADDQPSESDETAQTDQTALSDQTAQAEFANLNDGCLRCICEASSDCSPQVRCHVVGPNDYYCGPFQISYSYWDDAGQPGQDQTDPMDFEDCMNDIECSIDTVNGYMKKWSRDCNGDGQVNCEDFARIHKTGPHGCNSTWVLKTPYFERFKECYLDY